MAWTYLALPLTLVVVLVVHLKPIPCCPIWLTPKDANVRHVCIAYICCSGLYYPMFNPRNPTIPACNQIAL